jgi:hypothetical protein
MHYKGEELVLTEKLIETINFYLLSTELIMEVWDRFMKILKRQKEQGSKSILALELMHFLDEREYSIVSQPFFRFFDVIDKVAADRCTFEEFLPALVTFNLFSRSEILGFVF